MCHLDVVFSQVDNYKRDRQLTVLVINIESPQFRTGGYLNNLLVVQNLYSHVLVFLIGLFQYTTGYIYFLA